MFRYQRHVGMKQEAENYNLMFAFNLNTGSVVSVKCFTILAYSTGPVLVIVPAIWNWSELAKVGAGTKVSAKCS